MTMLTEPVGSLPRPIKLQQAFAAFDAGRIKHDDLAKEQDAACQDSITRMEATGSPIVSDGEQRMSSFATYPITDTLAGTGLADHLVGDGQYFAIFTDGHHRQLPAPHRRPVPLQDLRLAVCREGDEDGDEAAEAGGHRAVDAGPALSRSTATSTGYSREDFLSDLCDECEKDIRARGSRPAPSVSRSTSRKAASPAAPIPTIRGPGEKCCRTSSSSITG